MRISLFITAACLLIVGAGVVVGQHSQAMTMTIGTQPQATRVADVTPGTGGIQTWTRMMELGGLENFGKAPQTMFVPSDDAFQNSSDRRAEGAVVAGQSDARRAFLARGAPIRG